MADSNEILETVALIDQDVSDKVGWVVEQIASNAYDPGEPGTAWAGRIDIIAKTMQRFGLAEPEADQVVRQAQHELWKGGGEGAGQVRRRLMLSRLNTIRAIVLEQMKEPRGMMVWQFIRERENGRIRRDASGHPTMLKIPKREVIHKGVDVQAIRLLLDIERTIAELMDMNSGENGEEMLSRIFAKIEQDADGNETRTTTVSVEQVKKASPAAQAVLRKALEQQGKRTKVKSTVVPALPPGPTS